MVALVLDSLPQRWKEMAVWLCKTSWLMLDAVHAFSQNVVMYTSQSVSTYT